MANALKCLMFNIKDKDERTRIRESVAEIMQDNPDMTENEAMIQSAEYILAEYEDAKRDVVDQIITKYKAVVDKRTPKKTTKVEPEKTTKVEPPKETAKVEPPKETESTKQNTTDSGAELTFNKRNRTTKGIEWKDIENDNDALKVKKVVKQKVVPKPDYETMIDDGMQPAVAHIIKQVYDSIAVSPKGRAMSDDLIKSYINGSNRVMNGVLEWGIDKKSGAHAWIMNMAEKAATMQKIYGGKPIEIIALSDSDKQTAKRLLDYIYPEGLRKHADEIRAMGGNKLLEALQPNLNDLTKAISDISKGWPNKMESWVSRGYRIVKNEDGKFSLVNKYNRTISLHDTEQAATEAARELVAIKKKETTISEKGISVEMAKRTGIAYRAEGENVSSDKVRDMFGFKGINFGNWMKGETPANITERQLHLNHTYDSFMDLADILGLPPKAMSLNGMLGVAIGAQGSGGNAAAHFVPGVNEINLTRTSGAGSLAHEWGHALDHYFANQGDLGRVTDPFVTSNLDRLKRTPGELRPEIVTAFDSIVQTTNKREMTKEEALEFDNSNLERVNKNINSWFEGGMKREAVRLGIEEDFNRLADRIRNNDLGEGLERVSSKAALSPVMIELRDLYKKARGRAYDLNDMLSLQLNLNSRNYNLAHKDEVLDHIPQTSTEYSKNASVLDKGKSKLYWSTPWEKFARAFDAFVSDTLEEKAASNTYLSHAGRADETVPQGKERETINKAFKTLIGEFKTKDNILYSKSTETIEDFANKVKNDLGLKAFHVFEKNDGDIELSSLIVNPAEQKSGKGTEAMNRLIAYADSKGKRIVLTPGLPNDNHGTTSRMRLVRFYKRFGFIENKGRSLDYAIGAGKMYRDPVVGKFSKSTGTTGTSTTDLKAMSPKRVNDLVGAGKIQVVQSVDELPEAMQDTGASYNPDDITGAEALYDRTNDKLYLVADMLNKDNLNQVLSHELLHRALATDKNVMQTFDRFKADMEERFNAALDGKGSKFEIEAAKRVVDAETPVEDQVEEFGAYLVTQYQTKPASLPGKLIKLIKDFIAAVKIYLVKNGLDMGFVKSLTPADLVAMSGYGEKVGGTTGATGAMYSFAGKQSYTADEHALSTAQDRIDAGEDVETVRQETGWHKGVDGKWRYEISDSEAKLKKPYPEKGQRFGDIARLLYNKQLEQGELKRVTVGDILDHPKLFAAYPKLADINVTTQDGKGASISLGQPPTIYIGEDVQMSDVKSTLLHELQHGIQTIEGFASGGSGKSGDYKRLAGEVEARNVQARAKMDETFLSMVPPAETADVSDADVIIKWNGMKMDMAGPSNETLDNLIYKYQDRFIGLKRQQQKTAPVISDETDTYLKEELYSQRKAQLIKEFNDNQLDPLLKKLYDNKIDLDTFQRFLQARHAESRNAVMAERNPNQAMIDDKIEQAQEALENAKTTKETNDALRELRVWENAKPFKGTEEDRLSLSGMSDDTAQAILDQADPVMFQLGYKIDEITQGTLDLLVDYGMETQETVDALKAQWDHYVPLHRDEAHPEQGGFGQPIGHGFSVSGSGMKQATGSNADVTNIMAHLAAAREQMITRGEKNLVTKTLAKFIEENPDPDFAEVNTPDIQNKLVNGLVEPVAANYFIMKQKPNVVSFRADGKDSYIVFNENKQSNMDLAASMQNLDGADLDRIEKIMAKGTRWFASINTQYNLAFGLFNFIRDVGATALNLTTTPLHGKQLAVLNRIPKVLATITKSLRSGTYDAEYQEFLREGGAIGFTNMFENIEARNKSITDKLKLLDESGPVKFLHQALPKFLNDFNTIIEHSTRFSAYQEAKTAGMTNARAASLAKNLTVNFNRKGANTTKLSAYYAFLNASIQGTARTVETLRGPAGKQILMGGVGMGMVMTVLGIMNMGADDWDKIPEFVKERSLILTLPGMKGYVAIPLPMGFNIIPNVGRKFVESFIGSNKISNTKRFGDLAGSVIGAFSPLGGGDLISSLTPTVLDPAVDLIRNKDWTGKPIYRDDFNSLKPSPGFSRTKENTSKVFKGAAEAINLATGGTQAKQGFWSPTGDQLSYVVGQLTGGTGREVMKVVEAGQSLYTGEDLPIYRMPIVGKFAGKTTGAEAERAGYYGNIKTMYEHKEELETLPAKERIEYLRDNPEARYITALHKIESSVNKLKRKRKVLIENSANTKLLDQAIVKQMEKYNMIVDKAVR